MAIENDNARFPERLHIFADPAAEVVWAGLETLDVALQHQVLRELASKIATSLASTPTTPRKKIEKAVAALHEAYEMLGESPSVRQYRELLERAPDLDLPSDSNIRAWLGAGWDDCLRRSLLPTPSDGDFAYEALEHSFTLDELIELALACAADLQKRPSQGDFAAWVRRPELAERFPRRPMTESPFDNFGGWLAVLEEARAAARARGVDTPLLTTTPRRYTYSKAEMKAALVEVTEWLQIRELIGDRSPRMSEFQGGRKAIQDESIDAGRPRALPNPQLISETFGSWDEALIAAGLAPLGGSGTKSNPRRRNPGAGREAAFTRDEKAATLRRAWAEIGHPFVRERFLEWRSGKLAEAAVLGSTERLPTVWMIEREFGGWRRACEKSIPGYEPPRRWQKRPEQP